MNPMTNWLQRCLVCAMAVGLTGCQKEGQAGSKTKTDTTASTGATNSANTTKSNEPATVATAEPSTSMQPVAHNPSPTPPSPAPTPHDDFESEASRRAQTESMIYATIRIKMEEAIEKRAALLKSGKDPSDQEVRSLEGTIMRARELLEENGEVVEPVDPPIVQSVPNP